MRIKNLRHSLSVWLHFLLLLVPLSFSLSASAATEDAFAFIDEQIATREGQSGIYVLDKGGEALMARAWLADHAQHSIEVQYFIWSTDNIGILAAEALLRAAKRGVQVNVIVDDLLIDAEDKTLIALSRHPNIHIRIYNPTNSVGVPLQKRVLNVATDFRGVNQRMHNKTFIVDGKVAITGGRNMAAEYYDYHQEFNFRDRDALLLGDVVTIMQFSFREFWESELSVPVAQRYDGLGLMKKRVLVDEDEVVGIQQVLLDYAQSPENFPAEVHKAINDVGPTAQRMLNEITWGKVDFISDKPGKNDSLKGLSGGGFATTALAQLVDEAQEKIIIQSPYLVMSDAALALFKRALDRGVKIRINTNSLASTDNLPAFSGYRNQRKKLLKMGLEIFEYKPDAATQRKIMQKSGTESTTLPTTSLHAKTLIVDSKIAYIGTFNLDPRSENLNTEAGVIIHNEALAQRVGAAIEVDMQAENSWNAATDNPDQYVPAGKRGKLRMFQMLPLKPLL